MNILETIGEKLAHLSESEREIFIAEAIDEKLERETKTTLFSLPDIQNSNEFSLFCDGGSRGNPGPAGCGWVIKHQNQTIADGKKFLGTSTNNQAEYQALLYGLQDAQKLNIQKIDVFMDSELVVKQISGEYRVKNPDLQPLYQKALSALASFELWTITHVRREKNMEADRLANQAMDRR